MNSEERRQDNYKALHDLFDYIDSVLSKTESFIHTLDFGDEVTSPEDTREGTEIAAVVERYNSIFIRNRNRLADKLNRHIEKID